jgi:hypothetical protein
MKDTLREDTNEFFLKNIALSPTPLTRAQLGSPLISQVTFLNAPLLWRYTYNSYLLLIRQVTSTTNIKVGRHAWVLKELNQAQRTSHLRWVSPSLVEVTLRSHLTPRPSRNWPEWPAWTSSSSYFKVWRQRAEQWMSPLRSDLYVAKIADMRCKHHLPAIEVSGNAHQSNRYHEFKPHPDIWYANKHKLNLQ